MQVAAQLHVGHDDGAPAERDVGSTGDRAAAGDFVAGILGAVLVGRGMVWGCDGVMKWQGCGNGVRKICIMFFRCFVDAEGEERHTVSMYSPLGAALRAAGRDILTTDTLLIICYASCESSVMINRLFVEPETRMWLT